MDDDNAYTGTYTRTTVIREEFTGLSRDRLAALTSSNNNNCYIHRINGCDAAERGDGAMGAINSYTAGLLGFYNTGAATAANDSGYETDDTLPYNSDDEEGGAATGGGGGGGGGRAGGGGVSGKAHKHKRARHSGARARTHVGNVGCYDDGCGVDSGADTLSDNEVSGGDRGVRGSWLNPFSSRVRSKSGPPVRSRQTHSGSDSDSCADSADSAYYSSPHVRTTTKATTTKATAPSKGYVRRLVSEIRGRVGYCFARWWMVLLVSLVFCVAGAEVPPEASTAVFATRWAYVCVLFAVTLACATGSPWLLAVYGAAAFGCGMCGHVYIGADGLAAGVSEVTKGVDQLGGGELVRMAVLLFR